MKKSGCLINKSFACFTFNYISTSKSRQDFTRNTFVTGTPSPEKIQQQVAALREQIRGDGSLEDENVGGWQFARYNQEGWPKGPFRRNDVLIPLQTGSVDLWRGVDWQFVERTIKQTIESGPV